jgi:hypothetical protein
VSCKNAPVVPIHSMDSAMNRVGIVRDEDCVTMNLVSARVSQGFMEIVVSIKQRSGKSSDSKRLEF